jgi:hypothetical protein
VALHEPGEPFEATLRDMDTHEQVQVPFESLADAVKARLA